MKLDFVWRSTITEEMVKHLDEGQRYKLFKNLDDSIVEICSEYNVEE